LEELLEMAHQLGLDAISITDHDCQTADVRAKNIGRRRGITVIPGVQLSATHGASGRRTDILCYAAKKPDRLEGLCHRHTQIRKRAGELIAAKVSKRYRLSREVLRRCCQGSVCMDWRHIMHALIESGSAHEFGGALWRSLFSPASSENVLVRVHYSEPADVIAAIHEADGKAILARPSEGNDMDLIEELLKLGLDGIEVWNPDNTPEETGQLECFARERGILMTGGSNFHGMYSEQPRTVGAATTPDEYIQALLK
jgi:predicted metal-dependent phosphoesterase TrpH